MNNAIKTSRKEIPFSMGGILLALGVVYGDIGTSPLYVMKSIVGGQGGWAAITPEFIIGALSLIIWTVTLITTVKYVLLAMRADNHGEGGIFALFALVRKQKKWLVFPAIIGGAALLSDGILTPAVTVTSAIEGLESIPSVDYLIAGDQWKIVLITILIITALFSVQRFGTSTIGKAFGPIMFIWFSFLGAIGIWGLLRHPYILKALNPFYAIHLLVGDYNKAGFLILGSVFLATTGAEALYSDIGHVGKKNIYGSWPFVKACLILNYFGQGAWILDHTDMEPRAFSSGFNPFFDMMPEGLRPYAVLLSTLAAIIASQALITGSFTLVSEAINLRLLPHLQIHYPARTKGQMYIPLVNVSLFVLCILVVLYFKSSNRMEAAYGLAITVTMLMTTILLTQYMLSKKWPKMVIILFALFFGSLELVFFGSSASKFIHGGYVAVLIATVLGLIMGIWFRGGNIEREQRVMLPIKDYLTQFKTLREDSHIPIVATNLVYLIEAKDSERLDRDVLYSILDKRPKRAYVYWFIHIDVTEEPFTNYYTVKNYGTNYCFHITLHLGYKMPQSVNIYLRQIVSELQNSGEMEAQPQKYTVYPGRQVGDFQFIMVQKTLTPDLDLSGKDYLVIRLKYWIKHYSGSAVRWFGLENSCVNVEYVPLFLGTKRLPLLKRLG